MSRISRKLSIAAITITFIGLIGIMSSASALTITPNTTPVLFGNDNSNFSVAQIEAIVGYNGLALLYKQDVGKPGFPAPSPEGAFANSYITTFNNTPYDPQEAIINWVNSMPNITGPSIYLYLKDGNQVPAWYIFNLTILGWNGMALLQLEGFWPGQGAISHVSIYGPTPVPEPTTLLLLGSGLVALCLVRRKFKVKD